MPAKERRASYFSDFGFETGSDTLPDPQLCLLLSPFLQLAGYALRHSRGSGIQLRQGRKRCALLGLLFGFALTPGQRFVPANHFHKKILPMIGAGFLDDFILRAAPAQAMEPFLQ